MVKGIGDVVAEDEAGGWGGGRGGWCVSGWDGDVVVRRGGGDGGIGYVVGKGGVDGWNGVGCGGRKGGTWGG